jgi:hypothetical protein
LQREQRPLKGARIRRRAVHELLVVRPRATGQDALTRACSPSRGSKGSLTDLDFDADAVGTLAPRWPRRRPVPGWTSPSQACPRSTDTQAPAAVVRRAWVANALPAVGRPSEIGCSSRSGLRPRCAIWKEPGATASAQRAGRGMADGSLTGVEALRHQAQRGSRTMVQNCGSPSTRR